MEITTVTIEKQLSNREIQLIRLLNEGLSRSEIADRMAMSIYTYDGYRKNIRTKLRIKSQADWAQVLVKVV